MCKYRVKNLIGYTTLRGKNKSNPDSKCKSCAALAIADNISRNAKLRNEDPKYKLRQRLAALNRIKIRCELTGKKMVANFNIDACKYFDSLMQKTNSNIQHALNGGEYYIEELGYWVDGYDKDNNIVYEFYERGHYTKHKIERDRKRQLEIENFLGCKFIVIDGRKENINSNG